MCLEVKGRHIWHDGTDWFQRQRKGPRDEAVVQERSRERLYVGLSRARDQLVVCGDLDLITRVGGPELARRLGI